MSDTNELQRAVTSGDVLAVARLLDDRSSRDGCAAVSGAWADRGHRRGPTEEIIRCLWLLVRSGLRFDGLDATTLDGVLKYVPSAAGLLFEHGADVRIVDSGGYPLVHRMATIGHTEAIDLLLARGADPNVHSAEGETALDVAVRHGFGRTARMLAERGAAAGHDRPDAWSLPEPAWDHPVSEEGVPGDPGELAWFMPKLWGCVRHPVIGPLRFEEAALVRTRDVPLESGTPAFVRVDTNEHGLVATQVVV